MVAFSVNLNVFGFTKVLSQLFQGSTWDILKAYKEVGPLVKEELEAVCADADTYFEDIFAKSMALRQKAG